MGVIADYIAQLNLLDALTTNSGPPPSAGWHAGSYSTGTSQLSVASNVMGKPGAGWGSAYWGTDFGANQGVRIKVNVVGDFSAIICGDQEGASTWDGYELLYTTSTHRFDIDEILNNGTTSLANTTTYTLANNDEIAFMNINGVLYGGIYQAATWTDMLSIADASYASGGSIGFWVNGTTAKFTGLYGGSITPISAVTSRSMLLGVG